LVDMMGRTLQTLVDKNQYPGSYTTKLEQQVLAAGIYLLRVEVDGKVKSLNVLKQ